MKFLLDLGDYYSSFLNMYNPEVAKETMSPLYSEQPFCSFLLCIFALLVAG